MLTTIKVGECYFTKILNKATKIIPKTVIDTYKKAFDVISTKLVSGETQIRVLSENKPEAGFDMIIPNLEDYYFTTLFNQAINKA